MSDIMDIEIGKFTLESLTTGMYSDSKIVYREYIQNSVDALETAVEKGIIEKQSMRIDIIVNEVDGLITFKDNGIGISKNEVRSTLLNIGDSKKRHSNNRGFRGIGRLGGMSYCDELVFSTSAEGESIRTNISFNCRRLRELLVPGRYENYDLSNVLEEITTITENEEKEERHYFSVAMHNVSDISDLLNLTEAKKYISQVAPIPYKTRYFTRTADIHRYLFEKNYEIEEFPIFVGADENDLEPIYKPNRHRFHSDRNRMKENEIIGVNFFDIIVDDELYAVGWYADCEWLGTISESEISGLRVRKGNILIGDAKTLSGIFREPRFNGWVQGEIFVLTDKLIPNARRDDFEQNTSYIKFIQSLSEGIGLNITKTIREASALRNDSSAQVINEVMKKVQEAEIVLNKGFNSNVDKENVLSELEKTEEILKRAKVRDDFKESKQILQKKIIQTIDEINESKNYKINRIQSGIDRKSKKILEVVSDIISNKLSKFLVDEILDEIIIALNKK